MIKYGNHNNSWLYDDSKVVDDSKLVDNSKLVTNNLLEMGMNSGLDLINEGRLG